MIQVGESSPKNNQRSFINYLLLCCLELYIYKKGECSAIEGLPMKQCSYGTQSCNGVIYGKSATHSDRKDEEVSSSGLRS